MGFLEQARARQTRRPSGRLASGVLAFAMMAGLSVAGIAPAAAQGSSGAIETVTVTAQFTQQNIQATPLAISVVTADDLDQRGFTNLSQLSATVPSLTLNPAPAAFGNGLQAYIRGVGAYDTAYEHEPGVGMYVDDLYFGTLTGSELELLDLSRVEILRGPQGVLGGKNDIGGAIKLFTKVPTGDNSGYLEATYGSFNKIDVKGAMDLTIIPDHLFMRVSGMSKHQDGYVNVIDFACAYPALAGTLPVLTNKTNCKLGTQGGTNVNAARLALRAVINSRLEDTFAVDIVRDDSEVAPDTLYASYGNVFGPVYYNNGNGLRSIAPSTFFGSAAAAAGASPGLITFAWNPVNLGTYGIPWDQRFIPGDPYKTTYATYRSAQGNTYTDGNMYHSWSLSNILDWDATDWLHVKLITGYRQYNSAYSDDSDVSPLSFQLTTTYDNNREFQQEERFTGTLFDKRLEWTAGVFTYTRNSHSTGPVIIDAIPLVFEQNDTYETTNNSGYLHLIYHITDAFQVFGGWRYTSEAKTYHFNHIGHVPGYPISGFFRDTVDPSCVFVGPPYTSACPVNAPLVDHTSKTERADYRAGVQYRITDDKMVYFQFATGYRTGGTNSRPFDPSQLNTYGPETIKSYEIGAKTDWFDHRLRVNVALYDAEYANTIVPLATTSTYMGITSPFVENVNLGSSTNQGVELEVTAMPIEGLLVTGNYSYIDSTANPAPGAPPGFVDPLGTIPVGSPPILFPESQFNLSAQYTWHMGSGMGDLTPRLDYNWQDITYQAAPVSKYLAIPSHGILNARLTWDAPVGGWEMALSVTNATDERYFYDMFNLAAFAFGTVTGNPAPPREWMISVRKNF
jgi:iron complex outermembrane receptor protein